MWMLASVSSCCRDDGVHIVVVGFDVCAGSQVLLAGKSYKGGAALFTLAQHHPAVAGAFLENAFWCAPGR